MKDFTEKYVTKQACNFFSWIDCILVISENAKNITLDQIVFSGDSLNVE